MVKLEKNPGPKVVLLSGYCTTERTLLGLQLVHTTATLGKDVSIHLNLRNEVFLHSFTMSRCVLRANLGRNLYPSHGQLFTLYRYHTDSISLSSGQTIPARSVTKKMIKTISPPQSSMYMQK